MAGDPQAGDPQAEDEAWDSDAGAGEPMTSPEIAGHVRMRPGPALAAWLGQAQPDHLDEAGLVNSITGWRKLTSWAQAQELAAVAELGRRRGVMDDAELERDPARELAAEFAPNEVALALTLTQYAAEWWTNLAVSMSRRLPATWSALSEGTIDLGRAKLIDLWTTPLDDDLAQAVERKVLVRAGRQTTGQLRASLQRAVISVDPAAAERRRKQAEKNARVELAGEDSGTAALSGHFLPAAQASAAWARINGLAEAMKGNGAGGGIDLLRAQVFVGLLLGTLPQPPGQAGPGDSDPPGTGPDGGGTAPGDGDMPPGDGAPRPETAAPRPGDGRRRVRETAAPPPEDDGRAQVRRGAGTAPSGGTRGTRTGGEGPGPATACYPAQSTAMTAPADAPARRTRSHGAGRRSRLRMTSHGWVRATAQRRSGALSSPCLGGRWPAGGTSRASSPGWVRSRRKWRGNWPGLRWPTRPVCGGSS